MNIFAVPYVNVIDSMIEVSQGIYAGILAFISYLFSVLEALRDALLIVADSMNLLPLLSTYLPGLLASACAVTISILFVRFMLLK